MTSTHLEGVEQYPHQYARTHSLAEKLGGRGLTVERVAYDLVVVGAETITVRCQPRPSDGDRLWFWVGDDPIDEADHVTDAAMVIANLAAGGSKSHSPAGPGAGITA